jgi:hypothetical protein
MGNTVRTIAAAAMLALAAAACGPDDRGTQETTIDGTAPGTTPGAAPGTAPGMTPGTAPGMMPGDTMHMDTVPRTGAPGAPGTTGG